MKLSYWENSWPLDMQACPCDAHFVDYIVRGSITNLTIFHFGTGEHHIVGRRNLELNLKNHILGITASRKEYEEYINFIIDCPFAAVYYKVLFADIYTLASQELPRFDIVTLFHLCEFYSSERSAYAPHDDRSLVDLFTQRLVDGGEIIFYNGSDAFSQTRTVIDEFEAQGKIKKRDTYKTLEIYCTSE